MAKFLGIAFFALLAVLIGCEDIDCEDDNNSENPACKEFDDAGFSPGIGENGFRYRTIRGPNWGGEGICSDYNRRIQWSIQDFPAEGGVIIQQLEFMRPATTLCGGLEYAEFYQYFWEAFSPSHDGLHTVGDTWNVAGFRAGTEEEPHSWTLVGDARFFPGLSKDDLENDYEFTTGNLIPDVHPDHTDHVPQDSGILLLPWEPEFWEAGISLKRNVGLDYQCCVEPWWKDKEDSHEY